METEPLLIAGADGMNLEIVFGSSSIGGDIGRYLLGLREKGISVPEGMAANPVPICRRLIADQLREVFSSVDPLWGGERPGRIRVEVQDDLGRIRPGRLGSFNLYKSAGAGIPVCSISGHLVLDLLLESHRLGDYMADASCWSLWCHELVHLADWHNLDQEYRRREQDVESYLERHAARMDLLPGELDEQYPREWRLLNVMSNYRAEGLANLFEILIGVENPSIESRDQAVDIFIQNWHPLKSLLLSPRHAIPGMDIWSAISDLFRAHHSLAHQCGPWMLVDVLDRVVAHDAGSPVLTARARACLGGEGPALPVEEAARLVRLGIGLDLGSYLRGLAATDDACAQKQFLTLDDLAGVARFISYEDAVLDEYSGFLSLVTKSALSRNKVLFIATLKNVLGFSMTSEEIRSGLRLLIQMAQLWIRLFWSSSGGCVPCGRRNPKTKYYDGP
jgi:hypothetical protein